ncbi:MAG TPA: hypothetical protein PK765_02265 [bacterium]|nr:hypothetical protein [bacterium]
MEKLDILKRVRSEAAISSVLAAAIRGVLASANKELLADSIRSVRVGTKSVTISTYDSLANHELSRYRETIAATCTTLLRAAGRYALAQDVTIRFR